MIAIDYRQYGALVELRRSRVTMKLDRGTYHVEQTPFPVAFIRLDGQLLLVHATTWNRVDLSDPATGVTLTARKFQVVDERRPEHYLDYFYGALYPSPDGTFVVSDGCVWHPVGIPRVWDVRRWRYEDLYEAEDGESARSLRQVSYYWDKPMCWLDNNRLAMAGIGADDEGMIPSVEVYDVQDNGPDRQLRGPDRSTSL